MKRTDEPLMKRMQAVARQLDHTRNMAARQGRDGLRAEADMAHTFTVGMASVLSNPRSLQGFIAAWLLDAEAWLDALEQSGVVDMAPYHQAEAVPHD